MENMDKLNYEIYSLNNTIMNIIDTKEYDSADSVNSTTVNPNKIRYQKVEFTDLLIPDKECTYMK